MRQKRTIRLVYETLRRGWNRLTPEARIALRRYVRSQRTSHGYKNAGGQEDPYYRQFGRVLETVFSPWKLLTYRPDFMVTESLDSDSIYGCFFRFLQAESDHDSWSMHGVKVPQRLTTNAVCCLLVMQHQIPGEQGVIPFSNLTGWLKGRQHESGGFYASEQAPVPDMLSTSVALFTLRLMGEDVTDATDFVLAHWLDAGGFLPTLLDDYTDVEYAFYGLLALGSLGDGK